MRILLYMSDLALTRRADGQFDLSFENGDLQLGESLESAVVISIGSDARVAEKKFEKELRDDGWWGEPTIDGDKWGSLLHTLFKRKNDSNTLLLTRQYVEDSLKWLVEDGVVKSIDVDVKKNESGENILITLSNGSGSQDSRFEFLWNEVL